MTARTWRADGPGSFQAPPDVRAVQDRTGPRWTANGSHFIRWRVLVAEHGPVSEAGQ
ncbi:hypothetical protein MQE23_08675 [Streptomyces sp. HP-A2021]|uniref:hypothetical protein n=1 Tax=Streptomyces sp. HP-A2021 TaxID=2927875 RepID=UPI001FB00F18|nr:hypothetical protein [Streptomyces sp. HP-A2021]UOB09126.1 hypothetical protein MQE23_08675 [Streptomyces sp. HP-A2021]